MAAPSIGRINAEILNSFLGEETPAVLRTLDIVIFVSTHVPGATPTDIETQIKYLAGPAADGYGIERVGKQGWRKVVPADETEPTQGEFVCAECGTTEATAYVVTTLNYGDVKGTRTEVCRSCDDALRAAEPAQMEPEPNKYGVLPTQMTPRPIGDAADRLKRFDEQRMLVAVPLTFADLAETQWSPIVLDTLSGLHVQLRRAACGAGCFCAAEVRVMSGTGVASKVGA